MNVNVRNTITLFDTISICAIDTSDIPQVKDHLEHKLKWGTKHLIHFLSGDNIISRTSRSTPRSIFMPTIYIFFAVFWDNGCQQLLGHLMINLNPFSGCVGGGGRQKSWKLSFSFTLTDLAVGNSKLEITEGSCEQKGDKWLNDKLKRENLRQQDPVEICFMGHSGGLGGFSVFFSSSP